MCAYFFKSKSHIDQGVPLAIPRGHYKRCLPQILIQKENCNACRAKMVNSETPVKNLKDRTSWYMSTEL